MAVIRSNFHFQIFNCQDIKNSEMSLRCEIRKQAQMDQQGQMGQAQMAGPDPILQGRWWANKGQMGQQQGQMGQQQGQFGIPQGQMGQAEMAGPDPILMTCPKLQDRNCHYNPKKVQYFSKPRCWLHLFDFFCCFPFYKGDWKYGTIM